MSHPSDRLGRSRKKHRGATFEFLDAFGLLRHPGFDLTGLKLTPRIGGNCLKSPDIVEPEVAIEIARLIERPASIELTRYAALLPAITELESEIEQLTDAELTERAGKLRLEAEFGDTALIELCALGRAAAERALGERAFDVQLLGTMGLLTGHVVQMETGEGKTLAGALAAAGYALR